MINRRIRLDGFSAFIAFNTFFLSSHALAAGTWYDARNDAMGGTGVASSSWQSAVLANPARMTKATHEDNVSVIVPSAGLQITDKDKLTDKVDAITDEVDHYKQVAEDLSLDEIIQGFPELRDAAGNMAGRLESLRGSKANGNAAAAFAVTIPNETLPFAFIGKAYGSVHLRANVVQSDIDYLHGVSNGSVTPQPGDEDRLRSSANGLGALVTDYGIAMAHEFSVAGHPVSVGVTPKLQKTWLFNYTARVYDYDKDQINSNRYRKTDTGFNIDVGLATDIDEHWSLGLVGQNLIARDIDTERVRGYRDTWQIRPLVTSGVAWNAGPITAALDVDLTPTKRFASQEDSQYAGAGAEYRVLDWLQLRAGYRADMKSNDVNVATAGIGLSPFHNTVHLDLAGSVGKDNTWGAMAQLGFSF